MAFEKFKKVEWPIIVNVIEKLSEEGHDVWVKDAHYEGYGFKVIYGETYIDVWVSLNFDTPNCFYIKKYKRNGNVLDTFKDKILVEKSTTDADMVEDLIRGMM